MKNSITIFLLLACVFCFGQNLVPNPSFEDTVSCPDIPGQIDRATGWRIFRESPDYYNVCSPAITFGQSVPLNVYGYQFARTGNAYAGLETYWVGNPNVREIMGILLNQPLQIGQKYFASFYVSMASNAYISMASNKIGMRFSNKSYTFSGPSPIDNYAQVYTNSVIGDTINWIKISGSFVADSEYSYIAIGNFFRDSLTSYLKFYPNSTIAYYYVDDVCVSTDSLNCETATGLQHTKQHPAVSLFPNPFSDQLTFTCTDNGQATVSLYNFLGQQVLRQVFINTTTLLTRQLAAGIYFYELSNSAGVLKTGKVIKQ